MEKIQENLLQCIWVHWANQNALWIEESELREMEGGKKRGREKVYKGEKNYINVISICLHLSLSLCQCPTVWITLALEQILISGNISHPTLFSFFKIMQTNLLHSLHFHLNFTISLSMHANKLWKDLHLINEIRKKWKFNNFVFQYMNMVYLSYYFDLL